jgi:thioredoxin 1
MAVLVAASALSAGCGQQAPASGEPTPTVILNAANFDAEIAEGVVLVDFWSTRCGPCRTQGPIVDQVARTVQGRAKVAKLEVEKAPELARRHNISGIPALVIFRDGQEARRFLGVTSAERLVAAIDAALAAE